MVLGLANTKRPALERKEDLFRRINGAGRVPLEQLALSPQCGFASTMEGNLLTEDEQWAKLRLEIETFAKSGAELTGTGATRLFQVDREARLDGTKT